MAKKDTESKYEISAQFINRLKKVIPSNISLVDEISDTLNISNDSSYRRLRGETAISLDEAMLLCKRFRISLDILSNKSQGKVTFVYKSIGNDEDDLDNYLESVIKDFDMLKNSEYVHLNFAAEDIPLFHHLEYEFLTPFKFFYWKKAILNDSTLDGKKFNPKVISESTIELAKKIALRYSRISSTEVWTVDTINSTLSQIKYFWESGLFESKDAALHVCDD